MVRLPIAFSTVRDERFLLLTRREDGKRVAVRVGEKLTAFMELEASIRVSGDTLFEG